MQDQSLDAIIQILHYGLVEIKFIRLALRKGVVLGLDLSDLVAGRIPDTPGFHERMIYHPTH